ncbi:MAG: Wzz/FepE/Etk N-terminal domain-containing protein [Ignavibacteriales bacterium]|nr:Wzz/FepE/Etk N-terminal domain-containing protein [Ignavibacteriales bacterium]
MTYHEILNILIFNRKIILKITSISTLFLFIILVFIYPITYSSVVKILPPEENKMSSISNLVANTDFLSLLNSGGSRGNSQLFAELLKSRTSAEYVINKCNLMNYFSTKDTQLAASRLSKLVEVEVNKEGIVSLEVDVSTPLFGRFNSVNDSIKILSARISNTFVEALDKINQEKLNSRAKRSREYVEKQLVQTKINMDSAEVAFKTFQEKNKAISLPEQLTAAIQTAAKLKSEIIFTEIQKGTLETNLVENGNSLEGIERKLEELKKQYQQIEFGEKLNTDYLPAFSKIPEMSLDLARLYREVKIQNEVYLLLQKQFYSEKIQENKDVPTIEVLDKALPPLQAKSPRLIFHTLLGALIIFLLTSSIVLYAENKRKFLMSK